MGKVRDHEGPQKAVHGLICKVFSEPGDLVKGLGVHGQDLKAGAR